MDDAALSLSDVGDVGGHYCIGSVIVMLALRASKAVSPLHMMLHPDLT